MWVRLPPYFTERSSAGEKLKSEIGAAEDGVSVALAGEDADKLKTKFGDEISANHLRAMCVERRNFVRGIFGKNYFAHQDSEEPESEAAAAA